MQKHLRYLERFLIPGESSCGGSASLVSKNRRTKVYDKTLLQLLTNPSHFSHLAWSFSPSASQSGPIMGVGIQNSLSLISIKPTSSDADLISCTSEKAGVGWTTKTGKGLKDGGL